MPIVLKFGSLNLLESTGPVQTCNGISFSLPFTLAYGEQGWTARNDVRWLVQFLKILRIVLSRFRLVLGLYRSCDVCINLFLELRNTPGIYVTCVGRAMPTSGRFDGTPLNGKVDGLMARH